MKSDSCSEHQETKGSKWPNKEKWINKGGKYGYVCLMVQTKLCELKAGQKSWKQWVSMWNLTWCHCLVMLSVNFINALSLPFSALCWRATARAPGPTWNRHVRFCDGDDVHKGNTNADSLVSLICCDSLGHPNLNTELSCFLYVPAYVWLTSSNL